MPPDSTRFQAPTGTRDFYPLDAARRRFILDAWRRISLNHGFDEIDGPTFEHLDLYTVKSGEAIVSELFSFRREGGEKDYALRPEFTPTLARMFAARAGALPRPTRWFSTSNYFRAERPQRGRLREFWQWNVDVLGDDSPLADAEVVACCVALLASLGLTPRDVRVKINHRSALGAWLSQRGVAPERHADLFKLLDARDKLPGPEFASRIAAFGFSPEQAEVFQRGLLRVATDAPPEASGSLRARLVAESGFTGREGLDLTYFAEAVGPLASHLALLGVLDWVDFDLSIVRGLAYYTGLVFEVHEASGAERAIAGGGRYDGLVELFGGPPTPAVGFGMGDVVLSLVLSERGLMPPDDRILARVGAAPDAFVLSNGTPEADASIAPLLGLLRGAGLHARRSYKATRNVGKLLQEAARSGARVAVILESGTHASVKDLATGRQSAEPVALASVVGAVRAGAAADAV